MVYGKTQGGVLFPKHKGHQIHHYHFVLGKPDFLKGIHNNHHVNKQAEVVSNLNTVLLRGEPLCVLLKIKKLTDFQYPSSCAHPIGPPSGLNSLFISGSLVLLIFNLCYSPITW